MEGERFYMYENPMRGEIYYCSLDEDAIGFEMKKLRPVVVIQNNMGNFQKKTTIICPITGTEGKGYLTSQVKLKPTLQKIGKGYKEIKGTICTEQIRAVDKSRLKSLVGCLNREGALKLDKAVANILDLSREEYTSQN